MSDGAIRAEIEKLRRDLRDTVFAGLVSANHVNEQGESVNVPDALLEVAAAIRELTEALR